MSTHTASSPSTACTFPWRKFIFSPFAFNSGAQEYDFLRFYYGPKMWRIRIVLFLGNIFWLVFMVGDFTDYGDLPLSIQILNYALRGIGIVTNSFSFFYWCGCVRKRIWLVESSLIFMSMIYLGFTAAKHSLKDDTTTFAASVSVVSIVVLNVVNGRIYVSIITALFSLLAFMVTHIWRHPYFFTQSAYIYSSIAVLATIFTASCVGTLLTEKEHRLLYLATRKLDQAKNALKVENDKSILLLENILPRHFVADPSLRGERFVQSYKNLVIVVHDLVGFTSYASTVPADVLVRQLNAQFSVFESMASHLYLEKLKSAGDSLMLFSMDGQKSASRCVLMAQEMINKLNSINQEDDTSFAMRVGVGMGQGYLGVMGNDFLEFDAYGEAVLAASKMEQTSLTGRVQVTKDVHDATLEYFDFEERVGAFGSEPSYFLRSSYLEASLLADILCTDYEKRLVEAGLPEHGVLDLYEQRVMLDHATDDQSFGTYRLKRLSSTNLKSLPGEKAESHDRGVEDSAETPHADEVASGDSINLLMGEEKTKKYTARFNIPPEQFRQMYKPNVFTTLFSTVSVTKDFLEATYKTNVWSMRILFLVFMSFSILEVTASALLFPDEIVTPAFMVKWVCTLLSVVVCLAFLIFVPYAKSGLMGSFCSLIVIFLKSASLYSLTFTSKEHLVLFGDIGSIFLIWMIFFCIALPWLVKVLLVILILTPFFIIYSILGVFSTTLGIVCSVALVAAISLHNVHYAMAKSFSKQMTTKYEMYKLHEEKKLNENLMKSVVPQKLLPHLKHWVDKQFEDGALDTHRRRRTSGFDAMHDARAKPKKMVPSRKNRVQSLQKSESYKFGSMSFYKHQLANVYKELHTSSSVEGTSLFVYLSGFQEEIACSETPIALITVLHDLFSLFDTIIQHHGCSKVKWMGSAYIAIAESSSNNDHATSMLLAATQLLDVSKRFFQKRKYSGVTVKLGLDSGSFMEAVVGTSKFRQDFLSNTLNVSSRMASTARKNTIQITERLYEKVKSDFEIVSNGMVEIKGKGRMVTYTVL